jgi:hypothetical protein
LDGNGTGLKIFERHADRWVRAAMARQLAAQCSMPVEARSTLASDLIIASHAASGGS